MKLDDKEKEKLKERIKRIKPEDQREVERKIESAERKAKKRGAGHSLLKNVRLLWKMLRDKKYKIGWSTRSWIVFALLYFVTPWDLIPDVVPGVGYIDDAVVVAWVCKTLKDEIAAYRRVRF
jgi:uncharacterized membrane protein YkvA (DUF1232 family)